MARDSLIYGGLFGWSPETWTAVGTLTLAAFTAALAYSTRRLAIESRSEVRAEWRPVIVGEPVSDRSDDGIIAVRDGTLQLAVQNVGRGPALRVTWRLVDADDDACVLHQGPNVYDDRVIAPGARRVLECPEFEAYSNVVLVLEVAYSDISRTRYESTFTFAATGDRAELIEQAVKADPMSIRYWDPNSRMPRQIIHRYRTRRAHARRSASRRAKAGPAPESDHEE